MYEMKDLLQYLSQFGIYLKYNSILRCLFMGLRLAILNVHTDL